MTSPCIARNRPPPEFVPLQCYSKCNLDFDWFYHPRVQRHADREFWSCAWTGVVEPELEANLGLTVLTLTSTWNRLAVLLISQFLNSSSQSIPPALRFWNVQGLDCSEAPTSTFILSFAISPFIEEVSQPQLFSYIATCSVRQYVIQMLSCSWPPYSPWFELPVISSFPFPLPWSSDGTICKSSIVWAWVAFWSRSQSYRWGFVWLNPPPYCLTVPSEQAILVRAPLPASSLDLSNFSMPQ